MKKFQMTVIFSTSWCVGDTGVENTMVGGLTSQMFEGDTREEMDQLSASITQQCDKESICCQFIIVERWPEMKSIDPEKEKLATELRIQNGLMAHPTFATEKKLDEKVCPACCRGYGNTHEEISRLNVLLYAKKQVGNELQNLATYLRHPSRIGPPHLFEVADQLEYFVQRLSELK